MELMRQEQKQRRKMLSEILGSQPPPPVTTLDEMKEGAIAEEEAVDTPLYTDEELSPSVLGELPEEKPMESVMPKRKLRIRKPTI